MALLARPYLFWLAAPIILVIGVAAGIGSASAEQPAQPPAQPQPQTPAPRPGGEAAAVRRPQSVVAGQVALIDIQSRTLIVERRDGKFVDVFLKGNTVIKVGTNRVHLKDLNLGDKIVVVGRPHPKQGVDAIVITAAARPDASAPPK